MSMRTSTSGAFAKAGNESHLLGYESLHLSMGGLRTSVAGCRRTSREDAAARRSTCDLDLDPGRDPGKTHGRGKHGALQKVRGSYLPRGVAGPAGCQGGQTLCLNSARLLAK